MRLDTTCGLRHLEAGVLSQEVQKRGDSAIQKKGLEV